MASPLTVQPSTKDTYLVVNLNTNNYGTSVDLIIRDRSGFTRRVLLEFDLSGLPAGQTITSASLRLNYYNKADTDPVGKTVWAYKLTRTDWVEIEATWNSYKTGSAWTAAGGDYVTSSPAGGSVAVPAGYDWVSFDVLAIVQDAYAASKNAEFLVKLETEGLSSGYSFVYFHSNNYAVDTNLCPKLIIEYTPAVKGRSFGAIIG
jgi:hypothetical protein